MKLKVLHKVKDEPNHKLLLYVLNMVYVVMSFYRLFITVLLYYCCIYSLKLRRFFLHLFFVFDFGNVYILFP